MALKVRSVSCRMQYPATEVAGYSCKAALRRLSESAQADFGLLGVASIAGYRKAW